jgi:hypothetical protein
LGPSGVSGSNYPSLFTGAHLNGQPDSLLADLEAARRASARVLVSFTGNEQWNRDENGFSFTKWKQRVDRFRGLDISSYIADGTIIGHLLLDEPSDPHNWNGHVVPQAQVEAMASYSKEIWPTLTTIIRAWPAYLKGYSYPNLDATWIQYHSRLGDIEGFIDTRVHEAQALGLAVVAGMNVVNGGGPNSGMPSYGEGKNAMNPSQLRLWGERLLAEDICFFLLWEFRQDYFSRPDVQAAAEDLVDSARHRPKKDCND